MPLVGREISDFNAQAFQNNSFRIVNHEDLRGEWSVFFFYPADFTFMCPTELEDLENNYAAFQKAGCEIYSISCDTRFVYEAWHGHSEEISRITYPVFADLIQAPARDFEALIPEAGFAERGTFIMNPDLKIVVYEVNAGNVGRNAEELFHKVQACQFVHEHGDRVCPAKWTPGAEALKPSLDFVGAL